MTTQEPINPGLFWQVLGRRASGMTLATTRAAGKSFGFVALSASHVTANPPTLLVSVDRKTAALGPIGESRAFALNYLAADQRSVADAFLSRELTMEDRFAAGLWDSLATGAPALQDALGVFDCEVRDMVETEAAVIVIGRVVGWRLGSDREPLVLYRGAFWAAGS